MLKFKAETNKPKQPSTSYMHFVQELYKKADAKPKGVEEISKFGAAAGQKWKAMSAQEKKVLQIILDLENNGPLSLTKTKRPHQRRNIRRNLLNGRWKMPKQLRSGRRTMLR